MPTRLKSALEKPTIYYMVLFALATGFFQSGFGLTYHEYLFHIGREHAVALWVAANVAQLIGIVIYSMAVFFWPRRATSQGTFGSMALFAVAAAAATTVAYGDRTLLIAGGVFLGTVAAMCGFVLVGVSRHASPRTFGRIISVGLGVGMVSEFVNVLLMGAENPSPLAWLFAITLPLGMFLMYRAGLNRVFFDIERGVTVPPAGERHIEAVASFSNLLILAGAAGLMKLIALLGIVRPKLVAPEILEQFPLVQAFIIIGIAVVGPLMDRSRRAGSVATVSSLTIAFVAVAFMQLASGTSQWASPLTYGIGYVMVGSTVAFAVISFLDFGSKNRSLLPFAIGGMVIHSGVEAAVMGIPDSVIAHPAQSAMLLAALFALVVPLSSLAKNRIWPPLPFSDRAGAIQAPGGIGAQAAPTYVEVASASSAPVTSIGDVLAIDEGSITLEASESTAPARSRIYLTSPEQRLHDFGSRYNLSLRERELLLELLDGHSNSQIATRLYISESTVKFHVRNILEKTGCQSRVEVINLYWREVL